MPLIISAVKKYLPPHLTVRLRAIHKRIFGRYEPEVALLPALCVKGRTGVDVGAALGAYTWPIWRYSSSCVAFEPNPAQAKYLRKAFGRSVRVEECALSDGAGFFDFVIPLDSIGRADGQGSLEIDVVSKLGVAHAFSVECKRMDDLDIKNVGFIKIDVEGHEEKMLAGATGLIARDRPNILIESENRLGQDHVDAVRNYFAARDYVGFFLIGKCLHGIDVFDAEKHQRTENWARERWLMPGLYVNNFLYFPCEHSDNTLVALEKLGYRLA